jgi:hypothetical protein
MKTNLDGLKAEIEQYMEQSGMAVFYGYSRALDSIPLVYWDCDQHPDYKEFIEAAKKAGAKMIVFHQRKFAVEQVEEAMEELAACDLPREDYRDFEKRLNHLRPYDGMVCAIELSFDHEGRAFLFDLRTDWYQELSDVLDELQVLTVGEDDDDTTMGGYFSKN